MVRTYAPRGQTPELRVPLTRDHLSAMSAVTPQGWFFAQISYTAMKGADSVRFLKHLYSQIGSKLLVVWDGSPIHRSAEVKAYLANGAAQHTFLERLPAYAPDLNPDEGAWQHLKHVEMRNVCCSDLLGLHHLLDLAVLRLRRKPQIIRSFFVGAGLLI